MSTITQRLKQKILDLAIRGKLVPQDPNDEPATKLLKRIRAEKEELVKAKKIKKDKNPSEIIIGSDGRPYEKFADGMAKDISHEITFAIPSGWAWARLRSVAYVAAGKTPAKSAFADAGIPYIKMYNLRGQKIDFAYRPQYIRRDVHETELARSRAEPGDLLMNIVGPPLGKLAIVPNTLGECNFNQAAVMIRPYCEKDIIARYLYYYLWQMDEINSLDTRGTAGQDNISLSQSQNFKIALPPLAEQKRIVVKIEELFAEIEKVASAKDCISRTAERINKKVLDLAIRGQLVPQNPNDEPATELLKRIADTRRKTETERSRTAAKGESTIFRAADRSAYETRNGKTVCIDDEIPFDIPDSWVWARLGDIFQHNTGKALNRNLSEGEFREYITTSNVYWDEFKLDTLKSMRFTEDELDKCTVKEGDILVCEGGDIGRSAIWNLQREVCIQNHLHRLRPYAEICKPYFCYVLRHYKYTNLLQGKGIGLLGLSSGVLHNLLIPVPPLAEQKRIVAKIEEVRKLMQMLTR